MGFTIVAILCPAIAGGASRSPSATGTSPAVGPQRDICQTTSAAWAAG